MPNRIELSPGFLSNGTLGATASRIGRGTPTSDHSSAGMRVSAGLLYKPNSVKFSTEDMGLFYNNHGGATLTIMKGTRPTSISQLTPSMVASEVNARVTDALLVFESAADHFSPSQVIVNPIIISTIFIPAKATGTAAWFWLRNFGGSSPQYSGPGGYIGQSVTGTVGLLGSGADLEMADVNILSGDNYRISAMKIEFPSSWEF